MDPKTNELVARFVMKEGQHLYIIEPDEDDTKTRRNPEYLKVGSTHVCHKRLTV